MKSPATPTSLLPNSLDQEPKDQGRVFDKNFLVNKLNYINFTEGTLIAVFRHKKYSTSLSVQLSPEPCLGEFLMCKWVEEQNPLETIKFFSFEKLLISDGQRTISARASLLEKDRETVSFLLPDKCIEITTREIQRHKCKGIKAQIAQNGAVFPGTLIDFTPVSLNIEVTAIPPQTFQWVNSGAQVDVFLEAGVGVVYSGSCKILKQTNGSITRKFILQPQKIGIQRYKPKVFRSKRQNLLPPPNVNFNHPLSGDFYSMQVSDISGSGFSVEEEIYTSCLLPGMVIPKVELNFTGTKLNCKAQVIYRTSSKNQDEENTVKCGLAILDMTMDDQIKLLSLLEKANDKNSFICNQVNLDDLWKFFFETGFIYPQKYKFLNLEKDRLKEIYKKIYDNNPAIFRHFIYQKNRHIMAHMAMIRFYQKSWLVHHHASNHLESKKAGLMVLDQANRYLNEVYHLYSAHLDFVFCYFRPENKFPRRIFGGSADSIGDKKACSLDRFAYFHFSNSCRIDVKLNGIWEMSKSKKEDFHDLCHFYDHESGGLMCHAFDLDENNIDFDCETIFDDYKRAGIKRETFTFSIKNNGTIKLMIILNISELGLNLSDITNSIKIFIIDETDLSKEIISFFLSALCLKYNMNNVPILLFPHHLPEKLGIEIEKFYELWILNMSNFEQYLDFLNKKFRIFKAEG